jgi:hypothetical protein
VGKYAGKMLTRIKYICIMENMIMNYFVKHLKNHLEYNYNGIKINIGFKKKKMTLFKICKYIISIVIEADCNEIKNIFDFIINEFFKESYLYGKISIIADWYIFNNEINKNQFYKINTNDNKNYRKMFNTFCLINNITGELFFNPDSMENNVISDRMKFIYNEYNKEFPLNIDKENIFSIEILHLYQVLDVVLNDMNKNKYTRKII